MTAFQSIFLSEGTAEGRGPQHQDTPAASHSSEFLAQWRKIPHVSCGQRTPSFNNMTLQACFSRFS